MAWQDQFRALGEALTSGRITTDEYRRRSAEILAEADREAVATGPAPEPAERPRVHIPVSAAWEAPSGEMTQIVGTRDATTLLDRSTTQNRAADPQVSDPGRAAAAVE